VHPRLAHRSAWLDHDGPLPNRRPAPRHDVGKATKRELTLKARRERAG